MNKISKAEAIKLINQGVIIKNDTLDGYVTIQKKPKGIFETRVYINGHEQPEVLKGNFSSLLKTMNRFDGFYVDDKTE